MRVNVLKPFWGKLDGQTSRTLLPVGASVELNDADPHTKTLVSGGFAAPVAAAKPAKAEKAGE